MTDLVPITKPEPPASTGAREGVSIVIPTYNEVGGAGAVLEELMGLLERELAGVPWEVLVVDDGSTDGTADVVTRWVGERLRLLRHPANRGYGAAIKTGVAHAAHSWVLITDADGTYPSRFIPALLAERDQHEMVVGARIGKTSAVPLVRRPPKWVLRKLASYLSRQDIPDLNSGLRVMRKDVLQRFGNILPDTFSYTTTITLAMFSAGYRIKFVPIDYLKREGTSKLRPIADTIGFTKLIIRTILYFDPLRVFIPLALFFILAAVGVGFGSWLLTERVMDVTTVLLFITGFHMLMMGMLADMLNRRIP